MSSDSTYNIINDTGGRSRKNYNDICMYETVNHKE